MMTNVELFLRIFAVLRTVKLANFYFALICVSGSVAIVDVAIVLSLGLLLTQLIPGDGEFTMNLLGNISIDNFIYFLFGVIICRVFLYCGFHFLFIKFASKLTRALIDKCIHSILYNKSIRLNAIGDFVIETKSGIECLVNGILYPWLMLCSEALVGVILFFAALYFYPKFFDLASLAWIPILVMVFGFFVYVVNKKSAKLGLDKFHIEKQFVTELADILFGRSEIRAMKLVEFVSNNLAITFDRFFRKVGFQNFLNGASRVILETAFVMGLILLFLFEIDFALIASLIVVLARLIPLVARIGAHLNTIGHARASVEPIVGLALDDVIGVKRERDEYLGRGRQDMLSLHISPSRLGHKRAITIDGRPLDAGGSVFCRGDFCLIVGPSGAGKTSFLEGVLGFSDSAGIVSVAQPSVGCIGFVGQEPHFFNGSIRRNLDPLGGVADNLMIELIVETGLAPNNDLGLQFLNRELSLGGKELSGGERKRLGLVRAMLVDSPLLCIDEPTSGLGDLQGKAIIEILSRFSRANNVLIFAVTHDSRFFDIANRVIEVRNDG